MSIQKIENAITNLTEKLLELARKHSWNSISDHCMYIMTEIDHSTATNTYELRKIRKRENQKKTPKLAHEIAVELEKIYKDLYDINFFIYHSKPGLTIVDIRCFYKSSVEESVYKQIKDNEPMFHCKVSIPPYLENKDKKFDINWELGGLKHQWKLFLWRRKVYRELAKEEKLS